MHKNVPRTPVSFECKRPHVLQIFYMYRHELTEDSQITCVFPQITTHHTNSPPDATQFRLQSHTSILKKTHLHALVQKVGHEIPSNFFHY